jgi:ferredoxin-thioredoxin reductase catalytic subunit
MIKMMISFVKDYFKYKKDIQKQNTWINKYASKKNYDVNPDLMINTNLKIWLVEMEGIYKKRMCPCFDPSGDKELDKSMICPCKYIDEEIEAYGTCHCALFGKKGLSKQEWKASGQRLMKEYRVPLNFKDNVLDTRNMPLDNLRNLPVPDASHQLKMALLKASGNELEVIVSTEQESINLQKISEFKKYSYQSEQKEGYYSVKLGIK